MRIHVPSFVRAASAAVTLLVGCKSQLAPEVPFAEPELRVEAANLWQPDGAAQIQGIARNLTDVTVNGQAASVVDGEFRANVSLDRGVNLVDARGTDGHGDELFVRQGLLAGDFASPDVPIEHAITLRVNEGGLRKATDMVGDFIDPAAIGSSVNALNPVYADSYGVLGWDAVEVEANLLNLQFSDPVITPDAKPGVLALQVVIPNLEVHIGVDGEIVGIDFSTDAYIGADAAVVDANVVVSVVNGRLDLDVIAPSVALNGFWYDTSLLPGDVEDYLLVDTIRGVLEGMLVGKLEEMIPPLLDSALADLDISFQTEMLGKQVSIAADFASASIDEAGLQVAMDIAVGVPGDAGKPWLGYLSAPGAPARPSYADDLGLAVSDDLLNNVFFQAWRSGMLQIDLDSARGEIEPLFLAQLGATDAARVVVDAQLPPVVVESEGGLQAQVTELLVRVETPGGENGEFLDLAVHAKIPVDMAVTAGVLSIDLGSPELTIDVRDSDWGASNNAIANLLAEELPIEALLILVGDIEFPLPSVAGITIGDAEAYRDSSGVYTTIGMNL